MSDNVQEFLEQDHESLGTLLAEFEDALAANDLAKAFAKLDLFWARLAIHIRAENLCLFPALLKASAEESFSGGLPRAGDDQDDAISRNVGRPSVEQVRAAVAVLREDHNFFMDTLAKAIKMMREVLAHPQGEPSQQARSVRDMVAAVKQRLEDHNVAEEEELYRWPSRLLGATQLARLELDIKRELENLPARFSARTK